ncbi:hypothetical protein ABUE31_03790 [Mesorhizobium sp. ZMM04-5]|uniref:Transposase n=1 Tax=Mesorhizobium marinum TaxID=3228790 RepID=A0ABV3QVN5_9HYPH
MPVIRDVVQALKSIVVKFCRESHTVQVLPKRESRGEGSFTWRLQERLAFEDFGAVEKGPRNASNGGIPGLLCPTRLQYVALKFNRLH